MTATTQRMPVAYVPHGGGPWPFVEMGLDRAELDALLALDPAGWTSFDDRERAAAAYARALSSTPLVVPAALQLELRRVYDDRELVVLATTIAQVNYWARLNHGLGVPAAGFFADDGCAVR